MPTTTRRGAGAPKKKTAEERRRELETGINRGRKTVRSNRDASNIRESGALEVDKVQRAKKKKTY